MTSLETLLRNTQDVKVIDASINHEDYIQLDLSSANGELLKFDIKCAVAFEEYIENHLTSNNAKVAFGGYNEERNLYQRSTIFKDQETDERNMHIGLDLWIKAGTPVLAALDGKVHSFNYNEGFGDYGPTIILEHCISGQTFYTLYGHLSLSSLQSLEVGVSFAAGQPLGSLGAWHENVHWPPHLHFQIIRDLEGRSGDFPGVCAPSEAAKWLALCPDPNLLLRL